MKAYAEIFFACLATGYFPKDFKAAKIVMVPKAGKSSTQIENYRPISLLEVPAKILQKILNVELQQHLEDNNILKEKQHGFRKVEGLALPSPWHTN